MANCSASKLSVHLYKWDSNFPSMAIVKILLSELLWHLLLATAWHISGPQPMVIIVIFIKCAL